MTYAEYFENHETENFSWCKPYTDKTGEYMLVIHDGELSSIASPDIIAYRYDGSLTDEIIKQFAMAINPNYDLYSEWTDLHIALDSMHEIGCSHCPFKDECDAMEEEMQDTDYR